MMHTLLQMIYFMLKPSTLICVILYFKEKSVMLAEALLEKGIDADMNEILPKIVGM